MIGSFSIRATWEAEQQARGGGRGGRGDDVGQGRASLPTLSWTVDVITAQGVSSFVEIPRPVVEPSAFRVEARGEAGQGQRRKSVRVPAPQTSTATSQGEPPKKKWRLARLVPEEESSAGSDETEELEDVDLEDTFEGTKFRDERVPDAASSEAEGEVSEGDEDDEDDESEDDED
ncbi:hypothetical protein RHMOL_Rhmol07G0195300 [Rhododendron molle]|uniref:Uncharacterized protein n=1 Tax=Rhododendron molle TaxID=49168 RepID=A0ACC0N2F1_RHOML|nr:hypothetical protein RHMOL_Rhmol07G0195300 [Rhododendron molle]